MRGAEGRGGALLKIKTAARCLNMTYVQDGTELLSRNIKIRK